MTYVVVVVTVSWCSVAFLSPSSIVALSTEKIVASVPPSPLPRRRSISNLPNPLLSLSLSRSPFLKAERKGNVFLEDYMHDNDEHIYLSSPLKPP
jgi:hypothetical protein